MEQWEMLAQVLNKLENPKAKEKPMRTYRNFEDYLQEKFILDNPHCLDDDIPDAFSEWLGDIDVCEVIAYADEYAHERVMQNIESFKETLKEQFNKK